MTTRKEAAKSLVAKLQQEMEKDNFEGNYTVCVGATKAVLYKLREDSLLPRTTLLEVDITPPRVAPPEGTPVLVWTGKNNKAAAILGFSQGVLERLEEEHKGPHLRVFVGGHSRCFPEWSVLVEKEE
jgi:hypothetical protein